MINISMRYTIIPGNAADNIEISTYPIRTMVASIPKYSAIPPQTPASMRSLERVNFFFVSIPVLFLAENTFYKDKTNFHQAVWIFQEKIKGFSNYSIRNLTYILIIPGNDGFRI